MTARALFALTLGFVGGYETARRVEGDRAFVQGSLLGYSSGYRRGFMEGVVMDDSQEEVRARELGLVIPPNPPGAPIPATWSR